MPSPHTKALTLSYPSYWELFKSIDAVSFNDSPGFTTASSFGGVVILQPNNLFPS